MANERTRFHAWCKNGAALDGANVGLARSLHVLSGSPFCAEDRLAQRSLRSNGQETKGLNEPVSASFRSPNVASESTAIVISFAATKNGADKAVKLLQLGQAGRL